MSRHAALRGLVETLRLYLRYVGISLRAQLEYRASFAMAALGHFLLTGLEACGVWVLFDRFGSLRGWQFAEVALLYGIVNVAFALAEGIGRGFDTFPALVKSGDFDRLLLRPRGTAFQVAAGEVQLMRVGRLLQGLLVLGWGVVHAGVAWSPAAAGLLLFSILGGACLFYGLLVLQATLAFWTVETLELMNTVTYGGIETAQYPLSIYRPGFRAFFTFVVPLACINYLPVHALLARPGPPGTPLWLPWIAPAVGTLFLLLSLQAWNLGVRRYNSTGS